MDRYDGKPFLRFLDCYVLSSIGHLSDETENTLGVLTPRLSETLGIRGSWFDIVATQMEFAPDLPNKIKEIWENGEAKAAAMGLSLDPHEFTRQFVDTNFPTA